MKDESPRIFRNLEKTAGRDGFDTIVGAAVASYGSLRLPNDTQVRDFGRLVDPIWDKIAPETRRSVAAALSNSSRVPRAIVDRLIAEPIEISAPFLMSSPVLDGADLATLGASTDVRMQKIVEGRKPVTRNFTASELPASPPAVDAVAATTPAPTSVEQPVVAAAQAVPAMPEGAAVPTQSAPAVAEDAPTASVADAASIAHEAPAAIPGPPIAVTPALPLLRARSVTRPAAETTGTRADLVRETLRRLALAGRNPGPVADPAPKLQELVGLAVQQDADRFYAGLRRRLMLPADMLANIAEDESGERLAVALKAMNAGAADALTMLMMLKPRIGLDVEAFAQMTKYYRALKTEDCAILTGAALRRPTVAAPPLEPQYADLEPLNRAAPRPIFGRRASRPDDKKGSKRA